MVIQENAEPSGPHGRRSCRIGRLTAAVLVGCWTSQLATAQSSDDGTVKPGFASARRIPAEVLDARTREVVILPSEPGKVGEDPLGRSQGAIGQVTPEARRLPEGYIVASREARFERDGPWYVLHLASVEGLPNAPPLRVLPNRRLAMLEAIASSENRDLRLAVTGRVTEFQGRNYILLEDLKEASVRPPPVASEPAATQPGDETAEGDTVVEEPTAEEIMRRLIERRPARSLVLPDSGRSAPGDSEHNPDGEREINDSESGETTRWPEETMLIDRQGRIVQGDRWWSLAFEDRGTGFEKLPVRLLPNRLLETALAVSGQQMQAQVLLVSGEVTEYKGVNYLLLRKVLARRDMGNFR